MEFAPEYSSSAYCHPKRSPHLGSDRDCEDAEASEDFISMQSKTQAMGIGDTNNVSSLVYTDGNPHS